MFEENEKTVCRNANLNNSRLNSSEIENAFQLLVGFGETKIKSSTSELDMNYFIHLGLICNQYRNKLQSKRETRSKTEQNTCYHVIRIF